MVSRPPKSFVFICWKSVQKAAKCRTADKTGLCFTCVPINMQRSRDWPPDTAIKKLKCMLHPYGQNTRIFVIHIHCESRWKQFTFKLWTFIHQCRDWEIKISDLLSARNQLYAAFLTTRIRCKVAARCRFPLGNLYVAVSNRIDSEKSCWCRNIWTTRAVIVCIACVAGKPTSYNTMPLCVTTKPFQERTIIHVDP